MHEAPAAATPAARATRRWRVLGRGWAPAHSGAQPRVERPRPSSPELENKEQPWRFAEKEEKRVRDEQALIGEKEGMTA